MTSLQVYPVGRNDRTGAMSSLKYKRKMKKLIILILILIIQHSIFNFKYFAQTWNTVGFTEPAYIYDFHVYNNTLYAGGAFLKAGNINANCIATWNGIEWDSLNSNPPIISAGIRTIEDYNNDIYIGGNFLFDGLIIEDLAYWNNIIWDQVGSLGNPGNSVKSAMKYKNDLYVNASFPPTVCDFSCLISRWDGTNWYDLDGGLTAGSNLFAMEVYNDELYVGGSFSTAGYPSYITVNGIARWDGTQWYSVGNGVNGYVKSFVVDTVKNILYVGGSYTMADDTIPVDNIAKWDGIQWSDVGVNVNCDVYSLAMYRGDLYAGGCFTLVGDKPIKYIARWDGLKWDSLGVGTGPGTVLALEVYKDELYVGGNFETAGGDTAYGIARWYVPPCFYYSVDFGVSADTVYLSDSGIVQFYDSSTTTAQWFWDFGDSETDTVQNPVHYYNSADTFQVMLIATYGNCSDTAYKKITVLDDVGIDNAEINNYKLKIYPNPTEENFTVEAYIPEDNKGTIKIYGLKGEFIKEYMLNKGSNRTVVHTSDWEKGIYICNLMIDRKVIKSEKMVVEN